MYESKFEPTLYELKMRSNRIESIAKWIVKTASDEPEVDALVEKAKNATSGIDDVRPERVGALKSLRKIDREISDVMEEIRALPQDDAARAARDVDDALFQALVRRDLQWFVLNRYVGALSDSEKTTSEIWKIRNRLGIADSSGTTENKLQYGDAPVGETSIETAYSMLDEANGMVDRAIELQDVMRKDVAGFRSDVKKQRGDPKALMAIVEDFDAKTQNDFVRPLGEMIKRAARYARNVKKIDLSSGEASWDELNNHLTSDAFVHRNFMTDRDVPLDEKKFIDAREWNRLSPTKKEKYRKMTESRSLENRDARFFEGKLKSIVEKLKNWRKWILSEATDEILTIYDNVRLPLKWFVNANANAAEDSVIRLAERKLRVLNEDADASVLGSIEKSLDLQFARSAVREGFQIKFDDGRIVATVVAVGSTEEEAAANLMSIRAKFESRVPAATVRRVEGSERIVSETNARVAMALDYLVSKRPGEALRRRVMEIMPNAARDLGYDNASYRGREGDVGLEVPVDSLKKTGEALARRMDEIDARVEEFKKEKKRVVRRLTSPVRVDLDESDRRVVTAILKKEGADEWSVSSTNAGEIAVDAGDVREIDATSSALISNVRRAASSALDELEDVNDMIDAISSMKKFGNVEETQLSAAVDAKNESVRRKARDVIAAISDDDAVRSATSRLSRYVRSSAETTRLLGVQMKKIERAKSDLFDRMSASAIKQKEAMRAAGDPEIDRFLALAEGKNAMNVEKSIDAMRARRRDLSAALERATEKLEDLRGGRVSSVVRRATNAPVDEAIETIARVRPTLDRALLDEVDRVVRALTRFERDDKKRRSTIARAEASYDEAERELELVRSMEGMSDEDRAAFLLDLPDDPFRVSDALMDGDLSVLSRLPTLDEARFRFKAEKDRLIDLIGKRPSKAMMLERKRANDVRRALPEPARSLIDARLVVLRSPFDDDALRARIDALSDDARRKEKIETALRRVSSLDDEISALDEKLKAAADFRKRYEGYVTALAPVLGDEFASLTDFISSSSDRISKFDRYYDALSVTSAAFSEFSSKIASAVRFFNSIPLQLKG